MFLCFCSFPVFTGTCMVLGVGGWGGGWCVQCLDVVFSMQFYAVNTWWWITIIMVLCMQHTQMYGTDTHFIYKHLHYTNTRTHTYDPLNRKCSTPNHTKFRSSLAATGQKKDLWQSVGPFTRIPSIHIKGRGSWPTAHCCWAEECTVEPV